MSGIIKRAYCHPIVKGVLCVAAFAACAEYVMLFIQPAWAAISFPIGERIQVNLGDVSQIVIAVGMTIGLWKSWKAERVVLAVKADVAEIKHHTNSLTEQIAAAARKEGELVGKQKGVDAAAILAEGQRQGREIARESAAVGATAPLASAADDAEVPVKDGRVASATERIAEATERASVASERVASATEGEATK